jgi:hypothetical protein
MPSAYHSALKWLSAAVWYVGATVLIWKGAGWLLRAADGGATGWPALSAIVALAIGLVRGRTVFRRAAVKNLERIRALEAPRPWQVFRPLFFLALAAMFAAALLFGFIARSGYVGMVVVGGLDLVIGVSLAMGAAPFWTWHPADALDRLDP